eukprot:gene10701-3323_t
MRAEENNNSKVQPILFEVWSTDCLVGLKIRDTRYKKNFPKKMYDFIEGKILGFESYYQRCFFDSLDKIVVKKCELEKFDMQAFQKANYRE